MGRSKSSSRWLDRQSRDPYVKEARDLGYRSRAVFKLQEIQEKDRILRAGMTIVDLGAAPGGWSQFAVHAVGEKGRVVALDALPMDSLAGVEFLLGDFRDEAVEASLVGTLGGKSVDLVMSDMAPNLSGLRAVDQPAAMYLAELSLELARKVLKNGGDLLVKVFQGEGFGEFHDSLRREFARVATRKPKSSRAESRELYLLARGYNV